MKKITVTHAGQTFTRRTDRTYTHLILAKHNWAHDFEHAKKSAASTVEMNWAYYVREAGPRPQFDNSPEELDRFRRIAAMGKEAYIAELTTAYQARVEASRQKYGDSFFAFAWAGRLDLAEKQAHKARMQNYLDVTIVPTNQPGEQP